MAGKIVADQIEHSTAGSLDTSYVVNGSAKSWVNLNGTGTIAIRDSLNVGSIVDDGTGFYVINTSSALANDDYSVTSGAEISASFTATKTRVSSTSQYKIDTHNAAGSWQDAVAVFGTAHGDLA
jgi:hypothetical protein